MSAPLATTSVTAPGATPLRWMVVLHGILGSGANWRSLARAHVAAHPERGVMLMDLRRHGGSLDVDGDDTLKQCARDVARTANSLGRTCDAVLGHSFGGKVAATWALHGPAGPRDVVVVDAPLKAGFVASEPSVTWVISVLRNLGSQWSGRKAFVDACVAAGMPTSVATWLSMNLRREEGGTVRWPLDLNAVERLLADYLHADLADLIYDTEVSARVLVVAGGRSPAWPDEDIQLLRSQSDPARTALHVLPNAGHWVHADDPDGLLRSLADFEQGTCWNAPTPLAHP